MLMGNKPKKEGKLMASLKPTIAWQSVTLASDEIWQVGIGDTVTIDTEATEADRVGITLKPGDTIKLSLGEVIYYKKNHKDDSVIHRLAVS